MYRNTQVRHVVAAESIVTAAVYKNTVSTVADHVIPDHRTRRIPQVNPVTAIVHAVKLAADNHVVAYHRRLRPFQVHADQIILQMVIVNQRAITFVGDKNPAVFVFGDFARMADVQSADGHIRR